MSLSQSRCVPSWDLDENSNHVRDSVRSRSISTAPNAPMVDFEVAELTWENGQLSMHGLRPPRLPAPPKPPANNTTTCATNPKFTWEKQQRVTGTGTGTGTGTLESIVNQATSLPQKKPSTDDLPLPGSWSDKQRSAAAATMAVDALVPCSNLSEDRTTTHVLDPVPRLGGTCAADCSTLVDSCSGAFPPVPSTTKDDQHDVVLKGGKRARLVPEWSGSATFGRDRDCQHHDTYECDLETGVGFTTTSTSMGSPENTSSAAKQLTNRTVTTADDHDSVCRSRPPREAGDKGGKKKGNGNCSVSTKRSRAAAIHNQSERKRRDKINQRMKTLQKLVPNSSKTDKASMLDEVIDYLKQLQAQVQMMGRMNMPPDMMLPMAMQQQLHMSMLASMGMTMGMGMGMGMAGVNVMDMNRPNITGMPPVVPPHFMPLPSWDGSAGGDSWLQAAVSPMTDPLSTFLACQSQPMTMDAYTRMAAMYQQMQQQQQQQPPASSSKS